MAAYACLAGLEVGDGYPVRLIGVINVSPESFYRESVAAGEEALRSRAEQMAADGSLSRVAALINVDMIGDRDLHLLDDDGSTPTLRRILRDAARKLGYLQHLGTTPQGIEDDHIPFLQQGVKAIDLIDFDYGPGNAYWHNAKDTTDKLSAESLKITGSLVVEMLRMLEPRESGAAR